MPREYAGESQTFSVLLLDLECQCIRVLSKQHDILVYMWLTVHVVFIHSVEFPSQIRCFNAHMFQPKAIFTRHQINF